MVRDMFFKIFRAGIVIVIRVIADDDVRPGDDVFTKAKARHFSIRKSFIRVGSVHDFYPPFSRAAAYIISISKKFAGRKGFAAGGSALFPFETNQSFHMVETTGLEHNQLLAEKKGFLPNND